MEKIVSREELYKEIWEISALQVANKYQLDYPALLKACKENNIPLPSSKYWAYKRMGRSIDDLIVELPPAEINTISLYGKNDKKDKQQKKPKKEKQKVKSLTQTNLVEEAASTVELNPNKTITDDENRFDYLKTKLDFLEVEKIRRISDALGKFEIQNSKRLHKKVLKLKSEIELWKRKEKNSKRDYRDYHDPKYERNEMTYPYFIKDVSESALPRLYRYLDSLFRLLELFGEEITDDYCIKIGPDEVRFEIIESTTKLEHILTKKEAKELVEYNDAVKRGRYASKPQIRKYDYIPNGIFKIKMYGDYSRDSKSQLLEDKLLECVIMIYESSLMLKTSRIKQEEVRKRREEECRQKELRQEIINNEKLKMRELLNTLDDYILAKQIREYAENLKRFEVIDEEKIIWILDKADWIDPLISKHDPIFGKREHVKDKEEKLKTLETKRYWGW